MGNTMTLYISQLDENGQMLQLSQHEKPLRRPSFLHSSLRLDGITELLNIVSDGPIHFPALCLKSRIQFKKSFLKLLKYCNDQEFMYKSHSSTHPSNGRNAKKDYTFVYYHITKKGREFLRMTN